MLENSSDAVSLRLLALVPGLALWRVTSWRAGTSANAAGCGDVLPDGFVPTVAACLFGVLTAGLTWVGINATSSGLNGGPGTYLSGAIVALAVAIGFLPALRRTLLRHAYG